MIILMTVRFAGNLSRERGRIFSSASVLLFRRDSLTDCSLARDGLGPLPQGRVTA